MYALKLNWTPRKHKSKLRSSSVVIMAATLWLKDLFNLLDKQTYLSVSQEFVILSDRSTVFFSMNSFVLSFQFCCHCTWFLVHSVLHSSLWTFPWSSRHLFLRWSKTWLIFILKSDILFEQFWTGYYGVLIAG